MWTDVFRRVLGWLSGGGDTAVDPVNRVVFTLPVVRRATFDGSVRRRLEV